MNRPIYKVKYPNIEELSKKLIPAIKENILPEHNYFEKMKGICCIVKNNKYPIESQLTKTVPWLDYLIDINQFVEDQAKEYIKLCGTRNVIPKIEGIWFSYYPVGTYFDYHSHTGVSAVAVLYLEKKENAGNLLIDDDSEIVEVTGEEGDLIIFPGFLPHKTTPNLSESTRSVITYDLTYLDV